MRLLTPLSPVLRPTSHLPSFPIASYPLLPFPTNHTPPPSLGMSHSAQPDPNTNTNNHRPLHRPARPVLRLDTRPETLYPSFAANPPPTPRTPINLATVANPALSPVAVVSAPRRHHPPGRRDAMEPRTAHFVRFLQQISAVLVSDTSVSPGGGGDAIMSAFAVYFPSVASDPRAVAAAGKGGIVDRITALNALVMALVPVEGDPGRRPPRITERAPSFMR
ncbi:hypothetical protein CcaverHIS631_0403960 [Cutaneotrichosporon cavernicola]|nr:hypothetical protein CcaverHIS631_0403960 [Cutaneotrichosporon cavernicola]